MISVVAIDDEPLALNIVRSFCTQVDFLDLRAVFTETGKALEYLRDNPVDLLLLDINMPAISGIDFYRKVPGSPMVIFTTAYSEYAVDGFNLDAIDYLLKPFEFNRFRKAAEKARDYMEYAQHKESNTPQFFFVRVDYSMVKVVISSIVYIEGVDNYIRIHFDNGKYLLVRMSMKGVSEKLPPEEFVRVHRSYILARKHITAVRGKTVFLGTVEIPVGTNYVEEAQKLIQ